MTRWSRPRWRRTTSIRLRRDAGNGSHHGRQSTGDTRGARHGDAKFPPILCARPHDRSDRSRASPILRSAFRSVGRIPVRHLGRCDLFRGCRQRPSSRPRRAHHCSTCSSRCASKSHAPSASVDRCAFIPNKARIFRGTRSRGRAALDASETGTDETDTQRDRRCREPASFCIGVASDHGNAFARHQDLRPGILAARQRERYSMRVVMIGSGYVGLVSGACFADFGHPSPVSTGTPRRSPLISAGDMPIYEPGLAELVAANVQQGRLRFSDTPRCGCRRRGRLHCGWYSRPGAATGMPI